MYDMELYSNFNLHARFLGDQKAIAFLIPSSATFIKTIIALDSKQELMDLKKHIEKIY